MIYVECRADECLVKCLTKLRKRDIVHGSNKPELCRRLARERNSIGLLDQDPQSAQPPYIAGLKLVHDFADGDVKVFSEGPRGNRLIVLCPRLEDWILKAARESGIDVNRYSLPTSAEGLHKRINLNLEKFERLLEDPKDSDRLKTLRRLLLRQ